MLLYKLDPLRLSRLSEFAADNPGVIPVKGADLTEFGYAWGAVEDRPAITAAQVMQKADPVLNGAFVSVGWTVRDKTQAELDADREKKIADIKAEAHRRIVALCPEWKQRNLTAQAAQLAKKGESNWTQEEADAWAAGEALWAQIAAIRAASDAIELMDPLPDDIQNTEYWP